tara:strand:+ start:5965 stop:6420 length:456 start_codon:yes stop_codon:yes gene_type:complete
MIVASLIIAGTSALAARAAIASLEGTAGAIEKYANKYEIIKSEIAYFGEKYVISSSFDMKTFYLGDEKIDIFLRQCFEGFNDLGEDERKFLKGTLVDSIRSWSRYGKDLFQGWVDALSLDQEQTYELRQIWCKLSRDDIEAMARVMNSCRV